MASPIRAQVLIDGDARGLRTALAESEADLAKLDAAGKKVEILTAAIQSAKDARAAMVEARAAAQTLDEQLAAAKGAGAGREAIKLLEAAVRDANREVRDSEKAWDASRAKLDAARSAAAAAGVDTRNLASEQGRLKTELEAATQAVQRNAQAITDAVAAKEAAIRADREAAAEEQRLAAIVEASMQRQKMAAQELLEAERRAAQEAQLAANKVAAGQREAAAAAEALNAAFRQLGVRPLQEVVAETQRLQAALARVREANISGPEQQQAIAAFQARLAELRAEAHGVKQPLDNAAAGARELGREAESMGGMVGGAVRQLVAMAGAIVGLQGVATVAKDVINTGAAFETLEGRLVSLLGTTDAAKDAFARIKDLARTTPFEVSALTEAYVKLTSFGLQPSMKQMQAIADTAATLGGGTEALSRVTLALGQAWTKSKLQGDEILQLAEAGVPVWDLLAQATGKNTAELQKMSEAGTLGRGVILKLIDALGAENMGASAKLMETYSGAVSNAKDALAEFYDMIAQSGVLEYLTDQIRDLLEEFDRMKASGELQETAKGIADGFIKLAEGAKTAVEAISAMSGVIKIAVEGYIAWRVAGLTLIPMLGGVGAAAGAAAVQTRAMGTASAAAAVETRALGAAASTSAAGVGLLGNALRLLKGAALVGIVTEVASLGAEFLRAKAAAEEAERANARLFAERANPVNGPAKDFELVATNAALSRVKTEELAAAFYQAADAGKSAGEAMQDALGNVKFESPQGIADLLKGLEQVRGSARLTADEIHEQLAARLAKLTAEELKEFGIMADFAFGRGKIGVNELVTAIDAQLAAALAKAGVNVNTLASEYTAKFREAAGAVELIVGRLDDMKRNGVATDQVFQELITKTLASASQRNEFKFLADQVEQFGTRAGLARNEVDKLLEGIRAKADGALPGIQSLAEAFEKLGLKSRESLRIAEQSAKEAFEYIKNNGGTINEQAQAWEKYAAAAKAANGGILPPMLRVQEELHRIGQAGQRAGAGVSAGMRDAQAAVNKVRSDAEKLADRLDALKTNGIGPGSSMSGANGSFDDMRKAGVTPQQLQNAGYSAREIEDYMLGNDKTAPGIVNRAVTTSTVNSYSLGVQQGLNDEEAKKFAELYNYYAEKANAQARNMRTLGSAEALRDEYIGLQNAAIAEAVQAAKRAVAEANAAAKASATNRQATESSTGQGGFSFGSRGVVTLRLVDSSGAATDVEMTSAAQADALVRALQQAKLAQS